LLATLSFHQKRSVMLKTKFIFSSAQTPLGQLTTLPRPSSQLQKGFSTSLEACSIPFSAPVAPLPSGLPDIDDRSTPVIIMI